MAESFTTKLIRWNVNLCYTFYRRTGARLTYIADDWKELRVTLPFNRKTKNRLGTIFGGSISASVDPFYMFMLIKILGPEYAVWDKAAITHFKKPARTTLHARFSIDDDEIDSIRRELRTRPKIDRTYIVDLTDAEGTVFATVEKIIHISRRGSRE
jgi:acyl-coenzyme A thioesterase PaaI-like protein